MVKNLPTNAEDTGDKGLIPRLDDPLKEEMEIQSSILAWEIPRTEEPSKLQSMESQRVGHGLASKQQNKAWCTSHKVLFEKTFVLVVG